MSKPTSLAQAPSTTATASTSSWSKALTADRRGSDYLVSAANHLRTSTARRRGRRQWETDGEQCCHLGRHPSTTEDL